MCIRDSPGRPVISSINCHTSKISEFVDYQLQPLVQSLNSYVKDTTDFLNKIKGISNDLPAKSILVTMDVKSLYTNIPNQEGIDAVKAFLEYSDNKLLIPIVSSFLWLILTLNNFIFNDRNFLQTSGVSMGTKCAPSYANLFMGYFEKKFIYPHLIDKSSLYLRYIDDIFIISNGTEEELNTFIKTVNEAHPTIKFDINYSYNEINFLDTMIIINANNQLVTTLYKKPTDKNTFIHRKSYHPPATKKSIPYSQALRLSRICSQDDDYHNQLEELKIKFLERGYKESEIIYQFNKASGQDRNSLLKYQTKDRNMKIVFSTKYHKNLPNIGKAMHDNWHLLHINGDISNTFNEKPLLAYRRNDNLKRLIGHNRISNNKVIRRIQLEEGRCSPCHSKRGNMCCKQVKDTSSFFNRISKREFKIFHQLNCKSKFCIYLLECTKCDNKPYIGKCETKGNERINTHRSDSKKADSIDVDAHYSQPGHDFFKHAKFTFIEKISKTDLSKTQMTTLLKQREDFWIIKLQTLSPNGFNKELNFQQNVISNA